MAIARMNAVLDNSCYRYSYLERLDTGKTVDCSIWLDRKDCLARLDTGKTADCSIWSDRKFYPETFNSQDGSRQWCVHYLRLYR